MKLALYIKHERYGDRTMRNTTLIAALLAIMLFVVSVAFAEQDKNLLSFNISPNPMDKLCTISVVLDSPMFVTLQVQTLKGTVIRDLYSGDTFKEINVQWDRNDNTGSYVPTGKYIVALDYNTRYTSTKKTLILK